MPGHDRKNFLAQHAQQIGLAAQSAFMRKQDLQSLASDRGGGLVAAETAEADPCSCGPPSQQTIHEAPALGRNLHRHRLAAQPPRRVDIGPGGCAVGMLSVTGVPTLEAFNTSWLSGMMPSKGVARISRMSSMVSISPRAARAGS